MQTPVECLMATGLFDRQRADEICALARATGRSFVETAVAEKFAPEEDLLRALARAMGWPYYETDRLEVDPAALDRLPTPTVFRFHAIPVSVEGDSLRVAVSDPFRLGLRDAVRVAAGRPVQWALAPAAEIARAIRKYYGVGADTLDRLLRDRPADLATDIEPINREVQPGDEEASVVKFVNQIIWEAFEDGATDIHIEPQESDLRIRYRIDGVLHPTPVPAQLKQLQSAIISRIKVMAGMDIAEKRLPQDGRIGLRIRGEDIDVRVSTMPTVYGESVSLRLLLRRTGLLGMDKLGLHSRDEALLKKMITRPHGILLVTGPTGSGKSTSLYAWLHTINSVDKRILTIEDPIEYEMPGINQIQVRPDIGLTFSVGLRHILRQDPDVIMVGEIRDKETAEIAIRAALTGHLVFSTLHTNDSAGAITRLIDMGIEPFLVASSLEAIVAQRLVRKLCVECRRPRPPDPELLRRVGFPVDRLDGRSLYEAVGCRTCRGTGYRGRTGVYEILVVTEPIRALAVARQPSHVIKAEAMRRGMHTLRQDGWEKVLHGITTIEEVLRVTEEDEALAED